MEESKTIIKTVNADNTLINAEISEERPLQELFPAFKPFIPDPESPHYLNLFFIKRPFLKYLKSNKTIPPDEMQMPYSNIQTSVGKLTYEKELGNIENNIKNCVKISKYICPINKMYVMKRYYKFFDQLNVGNEIRNDTEIKQKEKEERIENNQSKENEISENDDLKFLYSKYCEFALMVLFSVSPHSSRPISFDVILLHKVEGRRILVTELFMEYEGEPINIKFGKITYEEAFLYLKQILQALNYLECYHIEHNDIKSANILIQDFFGIPLLKLIDFDISENKSITIKPNKGRNIMGYSEYYASPEIITQLKKQQMPDNNNSQLFEGNDIAQKSMIFSVGVLMLELIKFIPGKMTHPDFESYKTNSKPYKDFLKLLNNFACSVEKENKSVAFFFIVKKCLSFNPNDRLSPNEFLRLITNDFESKQISEMEEAYQLICDKRNPYKIDKGVQIGSEKDLDNSFSPNEEAKDLPTQKLSKDPNITFSYLQKEDKNIPEEEKDITRANLIIRNLYQKISECKKQNKADKIEIENLQVEKNNCIQALGGINNYYNLKIGRAHV